MEDPIIKERQHGRPMEDLSLEEDNHSRPIEELCDIKLSHNTH